MCCYTGTCAQKSMPPRIVDSGRGVYPSGPGKKCRGCAPTPLTDPSSIGSPEQSRSVVGLPGLSQGAKDPAILHGGSGDFAPGHHGDIGWPEVASGNLSGGEELVGCHPSQPIPTRVIPPGVAAPGTERRGHRGPGSIRAVLEIDGQSPRVRDRQRVGSRRPHSPVSHPRVAWSSAGHRYRGSI